MFTLDQSDSEKAPIHAATLYPPPTYIEYTANLIRKSICYAPNSITAANNLNVAFSANVTPEPPSTFAMLYVLLPETTSPGIKAHYNNLADVN